MPDWRTTTKRFTPEYKTRPKKWRMEQLDVLTELCSECSHATTYHFYEAAYPDFCFCMAPDCDCACSGFNDTPPTP